MIILRVILFLILLLFSVVILGILKLFGSLAIRILFGRLRKNYRTRTNDTKRSETKNTDHQLQSDELIACAACSTYISGSSAVRVNHFGEKRINGWVCKRYKDTGVICQ